MIVFDELVERLQRSIKGNTTISDSGCWIWQGCKYPNGYGSIKCRALRRSPIGVHQLSYAVFNGGEYPEDMDVLHKCDIRNCCNPSHLFLGTPTDNMADMAAKGRKVSVVGERHPRSKLTEKNIPEICALSVGGMSNISIGKIFGVSANSISGVLRKITWKHIKR